MGSGDLGHSSLLIVGVGSIGERHLRCFARTNRVRSSICEIDDELRQRIGQEYAVSDCYKNLAEALEDPPTAAVVRALSSGPLTKVAKPLAKAIAI